MIRKVIWPLVALFAIAVFVARHEVEIPCDQCGKPTISRCLLARAVAGFDKGFLHHSCLQDWCDEHPIRFDKDGHIIRAK